MSSGVVNPCQETINQILARNPGKTRKTLDPKVPLQRQGLRTIEKCEVGIKPGTNCEQEFDGYDFAHYTEGPSGTYRPAQNWTDFHKGVLANCIKNPLPAINYANTSLPANALTAEQEEKYWEEYYRALGETPYEDRTPMERFEGSWEGGGMFAEFIDPAILSEGKYGSFPDWIKSLAGEAFLRFYHTLVYLFLFIHIITLFSSTTTEIFGIQTTMSSKIVVMLLVVIQLVWSSIAIYYNQTNIPIALWVGVVYFSMSIISAAVTAILIDQRRRKKDPTASQIFDFVGIILKGIQAIIALIFGIIFMASSSRTLKIYAVIALAGIEILTQIVSFFGLI